ncbi:hypothetical protein D3C76_1133280 [compost metagenome]
MRVGCPRISVCRTGFGEEVQSITTSALETVFDCSSHSVMRESMAKMASRCSSLREEISREWIEIFSHSRNPFTNSICARAMGPLPITARRLLSLGARWSIAKAVVAAVRSVVSRLASAIISGVPVSMDISIDHAVTSGLPSVLM